MVTYTNSGTSVAIRMMHTWLDIGSFHVLDQSLTNTKD